MNKDTLDLLLERAEQDAIVGYFGYGSLVNENTLRTKYIASIPATLQNWQRMWDVPTGTDFGSQNISLLTARPADNTMTTGVIVFDLASNLPQVDEREHNYDRRKLEIQHLEGSPMLGEIPCDFYVYEAHKNENPPDERPPILQSYLDAVLQGFFKIYGEEGVEHFISDTANFHTPIFDDRQTPKYPRSVSLTQPEQQLIDYFLQQRADISFIS